MRLAHVPASDPGRLAPVRVLEINILGWDILFVGTRIQYLLLVHWGVKSGMTVCLVFVLAIAVGC